MEKLLFDWGFPDLGCCSSERSLPLDFDILSEKICEVFPAETKSTYYIPRMPGNKNNKPVNAKWKLIDKYRNLRRLYHFNEQDTNNDELTTAQANDNISDIDELNNCAKWLKTFQKPWDLVVQNWQKTFPLRKIANSSATVEQYMKEWPILKHTDAYALIEFDFQQLYPMCPMSSLLNEYQKWEIFFDIMKNLHNLDKSTEEFIGPLSTDISQDPKNAIQIAAFGNDISSQGIDQMQKSPLETQHC